MRMMNSFVVAALVSLSLPAVAGEIQGKVTSPKGGEGILVYVVKADGQFAPPKKPAQVDQKKMAFLPFVTPTLAGGTVVFKNDDQVNHNVFSPDGNGFNLGTWPHGQSKSRVFHTPGIYALLCSLHPEMEGYVVVAQNPYFAMTKPDGSYEIRNVPDGSYTVRAFGKPIKKKKFRTQDFPVTVSGKTQLDLGF